MYHLCKVFKKLPDDLFFEQMDPFIKLWLYESWCHEIELDYEKMKQLGILIGSFTNPEAARKMVKSEKPDFMSTEEEFEQSVRMVREHMAKQDESEGENKGHRKRRRRVIE